MKLGAKTRLWTTTELAQLRSLAPTLTGQQIAAALGRSASAVYAQAQANRIKLHKSGDASPLTKHPDELVRSVLLMARLKVPRRVICREHNIRPVTLRNFVTGHRKAPALGKRA